MKASVLILIFATIASVFGGGCLVDSDTGHSAADYVNRYFAYSSSSPKSPSNSASLSFQTQNSQSTVLTNCKSDPSTQIGLMTTDYIGVQETVQGVDTRCNCNQPKLIADGAGMSTRFVMTIPFRTGQYGITAGTSQKVLDTKWTLLSYSGIEQRAAVAVKTQPPGLNGKTLWFINTHVEYYVWAGRKAQVGQLVAWINSDIIGPDPEAIVVVVGDFNGGPSDSEYGTMSQVFKNSWEVYNGNSDGGFTLPADWPGSRFDHIWYRVPSSVSVSVTSAEVLNYRVSDHRPYRATLKFTVSGNSPAPAPSPATSAPATSAPTTSAPSTSSPTPTSSASTSCSASNVKITQSLTGQWQSGGKTVYQYSVHIQNTCAKPITALTLSPSSWNTVNMWNMVSAGTGKITSASWVQIGASATYSDFGYQNIGGPASFAVAGVTFQ